MRTNGTTTANHRAVFFHVARGVEDRGGSRYSGDLYGFSFIVVAQACPKSALRGLRPLPPRGHPDSRRYRGKQNGDNDDGFPTALPHFIDVDTDVNAR